MSEVSEPDVSTRTMHGRATAPSCVGRALCALVAASFALLWPAHGSAAPRLHGVVLQVTASSGEAIVRHDAFGSMPAMTMPFRIVPRARAAQIAPGSMIDADVDTTTRPWTLSHVRSTSAQALTNEGSMPRVAPLRIGDAVPETPFVDQAGRTFRFSQLRGEDVVLSFIYTRCPYARMCPLISAKFAQLQRLAGTRPLHLVEVTLDPTYDRPPVLARYGAAYRADPKRWSLVVGDADPTLRFAAQFGISAFPEPDAGIIHTESTVLIGPDGRLERNLGGADWLPDAVLAQIDASHGRGGNWLVRSDFWLQTAAIATFGNAVAGTSGLTDVAVLVAIVGSLVYLAYRVGRRLFARSV